MNKKTIVFGVIMLLLTIQYAYATQDIFYYKVENAKVAGALVSGLADVNFSFYDAASSGASYYNETITNVNFTSGEAFLTVNSSKTLLDFSNQYWIELKINTTTYTRQKVGAFGFCLLSNQSIFDDTGFSGVNNSVITNVSGVLNINQSFFDTNYLDDTDTDTIAFTGVNSSAIINDSGVLELNQTTWDSQYLDNVNYYVDGMEVYTSGTTHNITLNRSGLAQISATFTDQTAAGGGNSSTEMVEAINKTVGTFTMNLSCSNVVDETGDDLCTVADTDTDTIAFIGLNTTVLRNESGNIGIVQSFFDSAYIDVGSDTIAYSGNNNSVITNVSGVLNINQSFFDTTYLDDTTIPDTIAFSGVNSSVLQNVSGNLGINQTTFDSLYLDDTDTTYTAEETYLYLDSTTFKWNTTQADATYLTEDELNSIAELNTQIADATLLISGGTLTNAKWCVYDGTGIDCNVEPVSDTDTLGFSSLNTTVLRNESGNISIVQAFFDGLYLDNVDTFNSTAQMRTAVNVTGQYLFSSSDLVCTDCISGTEISELADADISNTLTCSILTDDDTYALTASAETFDENVVFSKNITVENLHLEVDITNHYIYDNSTCVIIKGDTATLNIC